MSAPTALITGGNAGIGNAVALALAQQNFRVVIAARRSERGEAAVAAVRRENGSAAVDWLALDLADLASVRRCASIFRERYDRLDVLVNNAGTIRSRRAISADGYEVTFQVNHLGHFLLTSLLLDRLQASAPARIINVSSQTIPAGARWAQLRRPAARRGLQRPAGLRRVEAGQHLLHPGAGPSAGRRGRDCLRRAPGHSPNRARRRRRADGAGRGWVVGCEALPHVSEQGGGAHCAPGNGRGHQRAKRGLLQADEAGAPVRRRRGRGRGTTIVGDQRATRCPRDVTGRWMGGDFRRHGKRRDRSPSRGMADGAG